MSTKQPRHSNKPAARKTAKASKASPDIRISVYGCTDVGMVRTNNEDNFLVSDLSAGAKPTEALQDKKISKRGGLIAVSDGMGGAQAGEVASEMAVHTLRTEMMKSVSSRPADEQLVKSVQRANYVVWQESQDNLSRSGMGATLTAVLIRDGKAYVAEVGDSRAYLIRSEQIMQVTIDQSLVELLILAGELTREEAEHAPIRNVILQAIGTQPEVKVALTTIDLRQSDYLLLCSDGLSNKVTDGELLKFTLKSNNLEDACNQLVDLAKRRGGEDNITVVLVAVNGEGLAPQDNTADFRNSVKSVISFYPTLDEEFPMEAVTSMPSDGDDM
jgi:PPM family protein phosphatase